MTFWADQSFSKSHDDATSWVRSTIFKLGPAREPRHVSSLEFNVWSNGVVRFEIGVRVLELTFSAVS